MAKSFETFWPDPRTAAWRFARLSAIMAAAIASCCCTAGSSLAADKTRPLVVCLVSGSLEYKSHESLAALQEYLENHYPARCTRAFIAGTDVDHLPGLENLDTCDVMLLFTRRLRLSGEQLQRFKAYCLAGRPIVGVRTASHAVQTFLELDQEVFGGNYDNHYPDGPDTTIDVVDAARNHPILAGFQPFRSSGSLYRNTGTAADVEILLRGSNGEHTEPIAWIRNYKGARIFYTSLGHPRDFTEESFRRMLVNALFWTARREPPKK